MLTRLEVTGFKNLSEFVCDFGPYTCIAGPNSVGKSNIFDVIEFLSATTNGTFDEAAARLRSGGMAGGIAETFSMSGVGEPKITIAAEMIVPREVKDDFNRTVIPTSTYLRYEIELRLINVETGYDASFSTIRLVDERLTRLTNKQREKRLPWAKGKKDFLESAFVAGSRNVPYIKTETSDDGRKISISQDGVKARGRPAPIYIGKEGAQRSALSVYGSSDFPTVCAVKRELESWRLLALEPSAMRAPSNLTDSDVVTPQGGNLPKALFRMSNMGRDQELLERVALSASGLVDFRQIFLDYDAQRQQVTLCGKIGDDPLLPARSLSDGTLRFLTLCILEMDPSVQGLICFEEPENGIHPSNIGEMYRLLKALAVDPIEGVSALNPLRQVIVNTHSPTYVMTHLENPDEILFAQKKLRRDDGGNVRPVITLRPVGNSQDNWRAADSPTLPFGSIRKYLADGVPGWQEVLFGEDL